MNTPTPEQLQEFIEWYCNKFAPLQSFDLSQEDWEKEYRIMNDYVTHVLTNHEGFQSNAELKRKLAAEKYAVRINEQVKEGLQSAEKKIESINTELMLYKQMIERICYDGYVKAHCPCCAKETEQFTVVERLIKCKTCENTFSIDPYTEKKTYEPITPENQYQEFEALPVAVRWLQSLHRLTHEADKSLSQYDWSRNNTDIMKNQQIVSRLHELVGYARSVKYVLKDNGGFYSQDN